MATRHEKNIQRKLRVKERNTAIAKALRAEPPRSISTRGLRTLQRVLGLPPDPFLLLEEVQEDNRESDTLDQGASSKAGHSNLTQVQFPESAARAMNEPSIPAARDFKTSQQPEPLDVIFIAIDFEYSHYSPKTGRIRLREVGISMLDTRDIRHHNNHLKDVISTRHYRTVTDTKSFLFGESIDVLQDELVLVLKGLFFLEDMSPKQTRNIILVGHGLSFEIKVLKGLGIDLNLASSVIEIFDTEFLGYEVFGKDFKCSLSHVVQRTGILGGSFHNAGNDANFSLRAMFLLACHRYDTLKTNIPLQTRLETYRKLARF